MSLTPFLLFDGHCAEAMAFYQACLGGELTVTRVADTPMKAGAPAELHGKVAYSHLSSGLVEFTAADWQHPARRPVPGNTVALYVTGGTREQIADIFGQLRDGADPDLTDELADLPFGYYGHLADRYGVHWFFRTDSGSAG